MAVAYASVFCMEERRKGRRDEMEEGLSDNWPVVRFPLHQGNRQEKVKMQSFCRGTEG